MEREFFSRLLFWINKWHKLQFEVTAETAWRKKSVLNIYPGSELLDDQALATSVYQMLQGFREDYYVSRDLQKTLEKFVDKIMEDQVRSEFNSVMRDCLRGFPEEKLFK